MWYQHWRNWKATELRFFPVHESFTDDFQERRTEPYSRKIPIHWVAWVGVCQPAAQQEWWCLFGHGTCSLFLSWKTDAVMGVRNGKERRNTHKFCYMLQWIKWGPLTGFSATGPSSFVTFPVSHPLSICHSACSDLIKLSEAGKLVQEEK